MRKGLVLSLAIVALYFGGALYAWASQPGPSCKASGYCAKPLTYGQMVPKMPRVIYTGGQCIEESNC